MKIVYIQSKNKKKEVMLYSSTATALFYYLPLAAVNRSLSFFIILTALVLCAYTAYIIAGMFIPKKITLEEEMAEHEKNKKIEKYYDELRGPQPISNAKPKNLL